MTTSDASDGAERPLDKYIPEHSAEVAGVLAETYIPQTVVTTGTKAIVGAVVGAVTTAGAALVTAIGSDGIITGGEWVNVVVALAVGAGLVGPSVYASTNRRVEVDG